MQDIPEAEARALLSEPLRCEDAPGWEPLKMQSDSFEIGVAVIDLQGRSVRLYVQLLYRRSYKTKSIKHKFSVFRRQAYGLERVYQLQVNHFPRPVKNAHEMSHEHIGDLKVMGDASWGKWSYDEVIAHFCKQTNITFEPSLLHPEDFELKGQ